MVSDLDLAEICHAAYFLLRFKVGSFFAQGINVAVVHSQNQVEIVEVVGPYRA